MNAGLVPRCKTLADVGCDHAYTAIYLTACGRAGRCIAMDVAAGPLARAEENIRRYGLEERIETRRSDGLAGLRPGEADVIMIGGMGGPLMLDILRRGLACVRAARALVLQPQSELEEFRRGLRQLSLAVLAEDMCCEGGKYYTAIYAENAERSMPGDCKQEETAERGLSAWLLERYGPCLIAGRHPVLREFLQRELQKKEKLAARLAGQATEKSRERQKVLAEELQEISRLLELF